VPAAAVIRRIQALSGIIGFKGLDTLVVHAVNDGY